MRDVSFQSLLDYQWTIVIGFFIMVVCGSKWQTNKKPSASSSSSDAVTPEQKREMRNRRLQAMQDRSSSQQSKDAEEKVDSKSRTNKNNPDSQQEQQQSSSSVATTASPPKKESRLMTAGKDSTRDAASPLQSSLASSPEEEMISPEKKETPTKEAMRAQRLEAISAATITEHEDETGQSPRNSKPLLASAQKKKPKTDHPSSPSSSPKNSEGDVSPPSKQRKSKARLLPPPPQYFCDALAQVFQSPVELHQGTNKRVSSSSSSRSTSAGERPVVLHLANSNDSESSPTVQQQWKSLRQAFPDALTKILPTLFSHSTANDLRGVICCHSEAVNLARNGFKLLTPPTTSDGEDDASGFADFQACLQHLGDALLELVVGWIVTVQSNKSGGQAGAASNSYEEEPLSDLFADDYTTTPTAKAANHDARDSSTNVVDALLALLEGHESGLAPAFLDGIFAKYDDTQQESSASLSDTLLQHAFDRVSSAMIADSSFSSSVLSRRICAVANLVSLSRQAGESLGAGFQRECLMLQEAETTQTASTSGSGSNNTKTSMEDRLGIQALLRAAAYSVPKAGTEIPSASSSNSTDTQQVVAPGCFHRQLTAINDFPLCVVKAAKRGDAIETTVTQARSTMNMARMTMANILFKTAFKRASKETMFGWLGHVARANKDLVEVLTADLLRGDGDIVSFSSSRSFLLGLTSSLVSFCYDSLAKRLEQKGADAFDSSYFRSPHFVFGLVEDRNRLFRGYHPMTSEKTTEITKEQATIEFAGATHLFFLSSTFVRIAVHSALRMQTELQQHHTFRQLFDILQDAAKEDTNKKLPRNLLSPVSGCCTAWLGWKALLEDQAVVSMLTDFALLQLRWLVALAKQQQQSGASHIDVPDWMCRDPALWLSHLANTTSFLLSSSQADRAVEYTTLLLGAGAQVNSATTDGRSGFSLSPIVLSALIDILAAFVQSGVHRARNQEAARRRKKRWVGEKDGDAPPIDYRTLNIYQSFDKNDLGVTVFTNKLVREKLCPILFQTCQAVDNVEGVDADRDNDFSKYGSKAKISELLLRLWHHPEGSCRQSIVALPAMDILSFVSSVASVIVVTMDFGLGSFEKFRMSAAPNRQEPTRQQRRLDSYLQQSLNQATGNFCSARRFLAMLFALSSDARVACCLGGHDAAGSVDDKSMLAISNMVVQLIGKLTSPDGGTNSSLEESGVSPSQTVILRLASMTSAEKNEACCDLVRRRILMKEEYGLEISVVCHLLLALVTRWHLAATSASGSKAESSPLLMRLARNEDIDISHLQNVRRRLVNNSSNMVPVGAEGNNAQMILEHDGYVDHSNWQDKYLEDSSSPEQKHMRVTAKQDQMSHREIEGLSSHDEIGRFLDHLLAEINSQNANMNAIDSDELASTENLIVSQVEVSRECEYGEVLGDWVVSSESFAKQDKSGSLLHFLHKYDSQARTSSSGSGKSLIKEARKCHKGLPPPVANASIFICFAEERMDLARAMVTGPVGTPYAHGAFMFDIHLPASYPQVPPMVTFMTTGGGQVRFGPNLYTDGKVCISLLGSTNASDETQRWNPALSSLSQLMISIQSQILGATEPYFNEGNGVPEMLKKTPQGREGSSKYNNGIRLATLRYAMVEQLESPPVGFQEIIYRHFSLCRRRILVQAKLWMLQARGSPLEKRYERTYATLVPLLTGDKLQKHASLAPLPEDMKALEKLDTVFTRQIRTTRLLDTEQKTVAQDSTMEKKPPPAVNTEPSGISLTGSNPWAGLDTSGSSNAILSTATSEASTDQVEDDEDDMYS